MAGAVSREAKAVRDIWLLGSDDEQKEKGRGEYTDQIDIFAAASAIAKADLAKLVASDASFKPFEESLLALVDAHGQLTSGMLPKIDAFSGNFDGNMPSAGAEKKLFRQLQVLRNDFVKVIKDTDAADIERIDTGFVKQRNILIGVALASAVLLMGLLTLMARAISQPLIDLHRVMADVERTRDFSLRAKNLGRDEVGQTAQSFNQLVQSMQSALGQVRQGAEQVAQSAHDLSLASANLARSSQTQSDSASSMAATIEQMVVSISHVTQSSNEARDSAREAGVLAQEGGVIISTTANGMAAIASTVRGASETIETLGKHSMQISSVVKTIEEVAEQTNLLALNAAIEAARAGEQGRGFAVVADEVRKLAERTTAATHEIAQMIGDIQRSSRAAVEGMSATVGQVDEGVRLAARAAEAINQISAGAKRVDLAVDGIATALVEQSSANNSMANSVEHVAQKAEENHVESMGAADAAVRLEGLAKHMSEVVAQFKI
jgi:methyl-accepting chemotaxis protein